MSIKEWVKGVSDEELRRAVVSIQVELISRSISAAHDKIEAPEVKPAGEYDVFLPPPAADIKISIPMEEVDKFIEVGLIGFPATRETHPVLPYLLESVEIPSCPITGKEQLKGDPLDFKGMEI